MNTNASTFPLRIGPAGWSHPHWDSTVYPHRRVSGFHPLRFISRYFDLVEVNSTFYRPIEPEVARVWVRQVAPNPRFQFTVKLARQFTHQRHLNPQDIETFKKGLWPLFRAQKLGALLMQFPWAFRLTAENREFLIELRRAFHEFPLAAEVRHASWLRDEGLGTFIDYKIGFVNLDQPEHTWGMPPTAHITSPVAYARFHGRNKDDWFPKFSDCRAGVNRYDYLYSEMELASWKTRLERLHQHSRACFVVFNNEAAGKSLVNALEMRAMLEGGNPAVPVRLRDLYPERLGDFPLVEPEQIPLFPLMETARASAA